MWERHRWLRVADPTPLCFFWELSLVASAPDIILQFEFHLLGCTIGVLGVVFLSSLMGFDNWFPKKWCLNEINMEIQKSVLTELLPDSTLRWSSVLEFVKS